MGQCLHPGPELWSVHRKVLPRHSTLSASKSSSSHSSTCPKSSTSSSCARSKVPPEDRACPADLPAAPAQQAFRPLQTFQPGQQQQPVQQQSFQQFQPQQAAPVQQQNFQPQQQQPGAFPSLVQLRQLQNTQAQPTQQTFQPQPVQQQQQTFQPQQRFQPQAAAPQQPTAAQASVFAGNPFNLINSNNNFAQFDAQFGGSVPEAPGAAQLSSQIFSQPQAAPRQQPFTAFGSSAQQGVSVFGR